eukprot:5316472-Pyramimonas_sp.AAC.1
MQYRLGEGWTEPQVRYWYSLRSVERNEQGKMSRSTRTGPVKAQEKLIRRGLKRAIVEERKLYKGVVCACPECADHRLGCPMRRASSSLNFERARGFGLMVMVGATAPILIQCPFNREWNAGKPASPTSEEDDQQEADEAEVEAMAAEVDPAEAAPGGYDSDSSDALTTGTGIADVARDAGTPIDPRNAVTEEMGLSPRRRVVYRAGFVGSVKTRIKRGPSFTKYLVREEKATISNLAFRKPG